MGLQRDGDYHFDRYLFVVDLFTVQKASLQRSQALWTAQRPRDRSESHDRIPSNMTELPAEPFGPLARLLGYVLAITAVAMLVYAVFPEFRLLP